MSRTPGVYYPNPLLGALLRHCGLDRRFVRGEGSRLFTEDGRRFLDLGAQYGAVLLGHNAPAVQEALQACFAAAEPALLQPYCAPHAEALGEALTRLCGLDACCFTSTGAEAVEAALKLARAATGRRTIVSALGSYHGKTLGALAATGQAQLAEGFGPLPAGFAQVPFGDAAALAEYLDRDDDVAAVLLEPIQGERGVILPPPGYLQAVRRLCDQRGVALVLDEIQTGLGRTGTLLYSQQEGVRGDAVLLGKGLGGGLFPLGACVYSAALGSAAFAFRHSSTFANNNVACAVGLSVLRALGEQGLCAEAARKGVLLQRRLAQLAAHYPGSIAAVRGRGLYGAIVLRRPDGDAGFFLGYLASRGLLAYAFAAACAERGGALLLPSLGAEEVLRISPALSIADGELAEALDGVEAACALLERRDSAGLARCMGALDPRHEEALPGLRVTLPEPPRPVPAPAAGGRYAFLVHYTSEEDVRTNDPSFAALSAAELRRFCGFAAALPGGVVVEAGPLRSPRGGSAAGWIIALPLLPERMRRLGRRRVEEEVLRAVDLAAGLGAEVVGLGGLIAPYARRGALVVGRGPAITTGNTLTALMAVEALGAAARAAGRDVHGERVAVVGARGSVGGLAARLLARLRPRQLWLIGSPGGPSGALEGLREELSFGPDTVLCGTDLGALSGCGLVLSASSALLPVLDGAPLRSGAIVCDVARPRDASPALRARADLLVLDGGLVALPDAQARFGVGNLQGYPPGVQLPCLSETVLLALAGERRDCGVGEEIPMEEAERVARLAALHGFRLAELPDWAGARGVPARARGRA